MLKRIIVGHVNEILGKNKDISKERMEICKRCPLYLETESWGPICNPKLFLNTETQEVSDHKKPNFEKGCGCRLNAKTKDKRSQCPLGKWQ